MPYDKNSNLWSNKEKHFFREKVIHPICQSGPHCVTTSLAMLTGKDPTYFQVGDIWVNTQDPVSWSNALKPHGMKLAYCPCDVRKIKYYMDELLEINDLFLLCYYTGYDEDILRDPDDDGWVCGSHVVILHKDKIFDPMCGRVFPAKDHMCTECHTKRIFRVVPNDHERGL